MGSNRRPAPTPPLVAVLLFCGLRIGEALTLQVADQQGATMLRVDGEDGKPRTAVLPAPVVVAIRDWLQLRGDFPGPLFSTRTGAAMDARASHRLLGRLGDRAGLAGLHPHTLPLYALQLQSSKVPVVPCG